MNLRNYILFLMVHSVLGAGDSMFGNLQCCTCQLSPVAPVVPASVTNDDLTEMMADWVIDEQPVDAVADYYRFDWALIRIMASASDTNFVLSPLGLKLALAILVEAATGETQRELLDALGFQERRIVRDKFATVIRSLQRKSPYYDVNLGSRICLESKVIPRERFSAIGNLFYKTDLTPTNFENPVEAAKDINDWIANITQGTITHSVNAADVTDMVMLVINTLHFKGVWSHEFPTTNTRIGSFKTTWKLQKIVPYMNVKSNFYLAESIKLDANILRMPYVGNSFAMYLIVPNNLNGLQHVVKNLHILRSELDWLRERMVDLTLPKFKLDFTSQLDDVLKEVGVKYALEETASFPGIAKGSSLEKRLRISKVLQRSGIEVNERGTLAYSPNNVNWTGTTNKVSKENLRSATILVNRPFYFFIQDETTRQILLTGRVSDP